MLSHYTHFTPQEEKDFGELDFQRCRIGQLDFPKYGVPLNSRHREWVRTRERQREQQPAWTVAEAQVQDIAQEFQPFEDRGKEYSYAGNPHPNHATSPGPPGIALDPPVYIGPAQSESEYPDGGSSEPSTPGLSGMHDQTDCQQTDGGSRISIVNAMVERGNNLLDVRMHSPANGWKGLIATLDTGVEENWICRETVERLGLRIQNGMDLRYTTIDGRTFSSGATVEAVWGIQDQCKTYENAFRVAPRAAPFDVLLGRHFLFSEKANYETNPVLGGVPTILTKEKIEEMERNRAEQAAKKQKLEVQSGPQRVPNQEKQQQTAASSKQGSQGNASGQKKK